jgi:outer membrane protein OmpA-like peptidoglycan-associated protein
MSGLISGRAMNLALAKRRAAAVRSWLIRHGIEANCLVARRFGLDNPVGDNKTDEGRQANRRVELVTMSDTDKAKAQAAPKKQRRK